MIPSMLIKRYRAISCFGAAALLYLIGLTVPNAVVLFSGLSFYLMDLLAVAGLLMGFRDIAYRRNGFTPFVAIIGGCIILVLPFIGAALLVSH